MAAACGQEAPQHRRMVRPSRDTRPHALIGLIKMAEAMTLGGVRGEPAEGD
jgi:hypothetical protein